MFINIILFMLRNLNFHIADLKAENEYFKNKCNNTKTETSKNNEQSTFKVFNIKSFYYKHYYVLIVILVGK